MALNAYYDRPLNQNLIRNVGVAVTSAVVTSVAPTVFEAGQQIVTLAATNTSMIASALGKPLLGKAISLVAPAVGAAWSSWMLSSLGAIGYGAATSADHTLSEGERQEGTVIGAIGVQSLDAATNVYDVANTANILSPFKEFATEYGTAAANALAEWDASTLENNGSEIALRSGSDAEVIDAALELVKLDDFNSAEANALIAKMGKGSVTANGDTFIIGKDAGYDSGYAGAARANDGTFYYNNPKVYKILKANIKDPVALDDILWRMNRSAVETPVADGMNFNYTLNGIKPVNIPPEKAAIELIRNGGTDVEVMDALDYTYLPARMKELQELCKAGYQISFDAPNNQYILTKQ